MAERRTSLNRVRDRAGVTRFYFRPPRGLAPPVGPPNRRLSDDENEARKEAAQLLLTCIPIGASIRDKFLSRRLEELAVSTLKSARTRARAKGIAFELTQGEVVDLMRRQRHRCAVTGLLFRDEAGAASGAYRGPYRPSIDRLNCAGGYTRDNIRLVLVAVNVALSDWGDAVVLEIARAIAAKHPPPPEAPSTDSF